ncbi:flavin reductase family protein [Microlunatus flavus]|uniref:NADH-FMN oxidoreductase RutF, flavin reductase (DIM6/NTAB) family n=1 Tax=Microlunatus flavus TaxID=1036181 RepID=A0A1H9J3D2_9ACTN|nr:flavin reductase family protein [Microlunatus flavus]SEQ81287.1 NADH-FMN oxidoreductase RutF, flavin reductase (DIM6/NTAB) family [Microlunatus flavus]
MSDHFYRPSEGHRLAHDPFNAIVAPRPIGWIGSRSGDGVRNLAPYSFFTALGYTPPLVGFSSNGYKDSVRNAEQTGVFTWNLVTRELAERMNATSTTESVDEFERAGLTGLDGHDVAAPRVAEAPVSFECRTAQVVRLLAADGTPTDNWWCTGEVVGVHIDPALVDDEGIYRTERAEPVVRGGGPSAYYELGERFDLTRPR